MQKIFYILFISFILFSCDQEKIIVPTDKSVETNPVLERMRELGYDMNTVVDYNDEYYLVEGDIMISKNEKINTNQRHINNTFEFYQKRPIRLYLDNNFTTIYNDMSAAVDNAIYIYNHVQGARITIERTYKKDLADLVITKLDRKENILGMAYCFLNSYIPDVGLTGDLIDFNERSIVYYKYSVSQITHIVVHEIGHCIGREHTDTKPLNEYIEEGEIFNHNVPGSPMEDNESVMVGNSGGSNWDGFTHWDVISLRRLFPAISKSNVSLVYINRYSDNSWSVGLLSGQDRYQFHSSYKNHYMEKIDDDNWDFCFNSTKNNIFYGIHKANTMSGKTEIMINSISPLFQTKVVTPLHLTNANWTFVVGDYNKDGKDDIFCINRYNQANQKTTIHILNGATNYSTWLKHIVTPLGPTNGNWDFISGDVNNDKRIDVICINKQNISNDRTTIHVLNGSTAYKSWLSHAITPLHRTGGNFEFYGGDYNNDGRADVYAIKKSNTGTNSTEIHILNGANNFQNYLVQIGTSLPEVSGNVEFCN